MKKILLYIAALSMLLAGAPLIVYAQACDSAQLSSGLVTYTDYSVEGGRQACGPAESATGNKVNGSLPTFTSPPPDSQQISSNQIYADCMSKAGANPAACQASASQQTGVAPTNLSIQPGQITDMYGNPIVQPASAPTAAAPAGSTGGTLAYIPLEPLPGGSTGSYNSLGSYLNLIFNILLSLGAMVAVVTLVIGGISYMVSESLGTKSEARRRMQAALIGLFILLSCWLILHEINPNLTSLCIFNLDCGGTPGTPANPAPAATTQGATPGGSGAPDNAILNTQIRSCESDGGAVKSTPGGNACQVSNA